jgi:hypothetical protein
MATLTMGKTTGEFIISEANGGRARDTGTLVSGNNLEAGTILGIVTASGKYTRHAHGASDGSETVAGVLYDNVDATDADTEAVIFVRDCIVAESKLTYSDGAGAGDIATANTELEALGIIVR